MTYYCSAVVIVKVGSVVTLYCSAVVIVKVGSVVP